MGPDHVMFGGAIMKIVFSRSATERFVPNAANAEVMVTASDEGRIRELVRRWFLKESSAYAVRRVGELSPLLGVRPSRVDVREIGQWGYCTRKGRLSFSWQLVALPDRLRDYIVLHELTHLVEFSHSSAFKKRLGSVCPDFRAREKELGSIVPYDGLAPPA